jgi:hypothetical protein
VQLRPLRKYDLPDLADHVIHFTGRSGSRYTVDAEVTSLSDQQRLVHILVDGGIRAYETFGSLAPVVCLTESTRAAVVKLIQEGRYTPCGVGFSKDFVFARGGGPALYVRGDEWPETDSVPQPLRSRMVRFWPGADPDTEPYLESHLANPSEWLHEREWRVPGDLTFGWNDVKFLIVPDISWQSFYASWIESWSGPEYAVVFQNLPAVVLDMSGQVLHDGLGIWSVP